MAEISRSCHSVTFSYADDHMSANDTGQTGNILAADRVAFMRHCRGTFLSFGKRLFHFTELALLKGANFGCEFIKRCSDQSQCCHIFSMTVALQRLRRDRSWFSAKLADNEFLYKGSMLAYVPTAPEILPNCTPSAAWRKRSRLRFISSYHSAILSPKVVGSA